MFATPKPATHTPPSELRLTVAGEWFTALPEGALWWEDQRMLIVSDLHLEKGSSFARRGQLLPPYDTSATLVAVERLARRYHPETIVSLGDSFHDRSAEARLSQLDADRIRALTSAHRWFWIEGNHDPDPPAHLGGEAAKVHRVGPIVFRHEPSGEAGEIAGHLHPCARVIGRGKSLRTRCFASDGDRLVLPALGAYTGGLNVLDKAYSPLFPRGFTAFAIGPQRVYAVGRDRLAPDTRASNWKL